jgi:1,4-alpha-glucan branching enzyme
MSNGYFGLVLHGHIPWCKKSGTWPAGEEWLFEAMYETYIPMLNILRELKESNLKTAITINITPILAEQLADDYMKQRFIDYMENLVSRAANDVKRFENNPKKKFIAEFHLNNFQHILDTFYQNYYRNILGSFRWLQDEKMVELISCAATHAFLPLMESDSGIFSQIQLAVDTHKKYFGKEPKGLWLPECAYRPKKDFNGKMRESIDYWLNNSGIEYFFVDSHGILNAELLESNNNIGLNTNVGYTLESGISVFGRNQSASKQVWDAKVGYPGNEFYMEFHKKDSESGLNYWRITDKSIGSEEKDLYLHEKALNKLDDHVIHYISLLKKEIIRFYEKFGMQGLVVAPFDFELYGHWWKEGIEWLKRLFQALNNRDEIKMITISNYLTLYKEKFSTIRMNESSWGEGGHFQVWQNPEHGWIWPYINSSIKQFEDVLEKNPNPSDWGQRVLKQTARELLLMEGSDWPFLLYTKQAKEYANQRFHKHHQFFNKLIWAAKNPEDKSRISLNEFENISSMDSCFQDIKLKYFERIYQTK